MASNRRETKTGPVPHSVLSDRGVHLEQAHLRHENSDILDGVSVRITDDITVKVVETCPVCKKKVRGINHAEGIHHRGVVKRRTRR